MWEEARKRFPIGGRVSGTVARHCPFGIFVDLGDPVALGLVRIPEFLDEGRMTAEQYPAIGTVIEAVVLGHTEEHPHQVWLSVRPSLLHNPSNNTNRTTAG